MSCKNSTNTSAPPAPAVEGGDSGGCGVDGEGGELGAEALVFCGGFGFWDGRGKEIVYGGDDASEFGLIAELLGDEVGGEAFAAFVGGVVEDGGFGDYGAGF